MLFLAFAIGLTWLFWIPLALTKIPVQTGAGFWLFYIGGLGPPGALFLFLFTTQGKAYRSEYWNRLINIRRIPAACLAVIVLLYPVMRLVAIVSVTLARGDIPDISAIINMDKILYITPFWIILMLAPPLAEEIAWRGYALDIMQNRYTPIIATIFVSVAWRVWHLPL